MTQKLPAQFHKNYMAIIVLLPFAVRVWYLFSAEDTQNFKIDGLIAILSLQSLLEFREVSFFMGVGDRLFVTRHRQFFPFPPLTRVKGQEVKKGECTQRHIQTNVSPHYTQLIISAPLCCRFHKLNKDCRLFYTTLSTKYLSCLWCTQRKLHFMLAWTAINHLFHYI